MTTMHLTEAIAEHVWRRQYQLSENGHAREPDIQTSWSRVSVALASAEAHDRDAWRSRFESALAHYRFFPGGRILAGAGSPRRTTLFNCFVMGALPDAIDGIFSGLAEAMLTMQAGGGIGCDFSTLRPAGANAWAAGRVASGPVSFMQVWDQACAILMSTSQRRGAMMATLRCDHPDIERFIDAKKDPAALRHFNLSVLVSDAFMRAVEHDAPWQLAFPLGEHPAPPGALICQRRWSGSPDLQNCVVTKTISARALWQRIQKAAFETGDPGVLFIDPIEGDNNLFYTETISATNPCGEVPLPAHGACNLGSLNLTQFVTDPFGAHPKLDLPALAGTAAMATRMLDNVYEISSFPLKSQKKVALASRRIGLGITGLADALAMLGVHYASQAAREIAETLMRTICHSAYRTSIDLVKERGMFPECRPQKLVEGGFIRSLPAEIVDLIRHHGMHNSHLTAIAPAGSISLLANNVSSGMEPIFALHGHRQVQTTDGKILHIPLRDYAWRLFRERFGEQARLPDYFVEAVDIDPVDQLKMQAALQTHVDQAIAKTIQLPASATWESCQDLYLQAYQFGLKGCSMFRPSAGKDSLLIRDERA